LAELGTLRQVGPTRAGVKLKLRDPPAGAQSFWWKMRTATVVCTPHHPAYVSATTNTAIVIFATDSAAGRPAGGSAR
jgi:hypothetical protein